MLYLTDVLFLIFTPLNTNVIFTVSMPLLLYHNPSQTINLSWLFLRSSLNWIVGKIGNVLETLSGRKINVKFLWGEKMRGGFQVL